MTTTVNALQIDAMREAQQVLEEEISNFDADSITLTFKYPDKALVVAYDTSTENTTFEIKD